MAAEEVINKYTLKEWIRHPTTIILIVAVNVIWILIFIVVNMGKDKATDCMEQVSYLRERIDKLEEQSGKFDEQRDKYITTIIYKDAQIKTRDNAIDSLKRKGVR